MADSRFRTRIKPFVEKEISEALSLKKVGDLDGAFRHLERAHVSGQSVTEFHIKVHWHMFKLGLDGKNGREILGQIFRIIGASTKTPLGVYPAGNTGGANVSPFKPMPIPEDLEAILRKAKSLEQ